MKTVLAPLVLSLSMTQASAAVNSNLLQIHCEKADGTTKTVQVTRVIYMSEPGKAVGMNFGYNRGDEGYFLLEGNCEIRPLAAESAK